MAQVSIIIPTVDNPEYLTPCLNSLGEIVHRDIAEVIVVNNGTPGSLQSAQQGIRVVEAGGNRGWEGGLKLGLEHTNLPYVCFLNDDTYFPYASAFWLNRMLQMLRDPKVAAIGPSSNNIRGAQNIWAANNQAIFKVTYLIGLCFLVKRKCLDEAGGIDDTLPGGDDIDLSIRLRKAGYDLIVDRNVFVYHHLSTTGRRLRSDWDSLKHQEDYNRALWEKHGLKELLSTFNTQVISPNAWSLVEGDPEGDLCATYIKGEKVYELGCGDKHTQENTIGVDMVPKGQPMGGCIDRFSVADVVANVFDDLPFQDADCVVARHVLEHTHAPLDALMRWKKSLKHGGRLILAVPDESLGMTIPMNPEHKCSFTPDSLRQLAETVGYKTIDIRPSGNPISFVACFERNGQ